MSDPATPIGERHLIFTTGACLEETHGSPPAVNEGPQYYRAVQKHTSYTRKRMLDGSIRAGVLTAEQSADILTRIMDKKRYAHIHKL